MPCLQYKFNSEHDGFFPWKMFHFFDNSPKEQKFLTTLIDTLSAGKTKRKLKDLCNMRLIERHSKFKTIFDLHRYIVITLNEKCVPTNDYVRERRRTAVFTGYVPIIIDFFCSPYLSVLVLSWSRQCFGFAWVNQSTGNHISISGNGPDWRKKGAQKKGGRKFTHFTFPGSVPGRWISIEMSGHWRHCKQLCGPIWRFPAVWHSVAQERQC